MTEHLDKSEQKSFRFCAWKGLYTKCLMCHRSFFVFTSIHVPSAFFSFKEMGCVGSQSACPVRVEGFGFLGCDIYTSLNGIYI